jgi:hypothetical protein
MGLVDVEELLLNGESGLSSGGTALTNDVLHVDGKCVEKP